jgi:branched-chain amino acid aminotransferase
MEKNLTRDEVYTADEAFFTGTAAEVTPIKQLDRRNIGNGSKGEITDKIQSLYFNIVQGENEKYKNWLTYIS